MKMLKKDEKKMYGKFTLIAQHAIIRAVNTGIRKSEVAAMSAVLLPRISEILKFSGDENDKPTSRETLMGLIQGGFLKLEDCEVLGVSNGLTPPEAKNWRKMFNDADFIKAGALVNALGGDAVAILLEAAEKIKAKRIKKG